MNSLVKAGVPRSLTELIERSLQNTSLLRIRNKVPVLHVLTKIIGFSDDFAVGVIPSNLKILECTLMRPPLSLNHSCRRSSLS